VLASFGIGTFLTNDFKSKDGSRKSKALNMVIKLSSVTANGKVLHCVKISDELTKVRHFHIFPATSNVIGFRTPVIQRLYEKSNRRSRLMYRRG
jgi:nicotinic acid phosphoribosyltransferase